MGHLGKIIFDLSILTHILRLNFAKCTGKGGRGSITLPKNMMSLLKSPLKVWHINF